MNRICFFLVVMLMGFACSNDMTAPISSDVQLSAEDVAVTEVWLRVHIAPTIPHDSICITRNDATLITVGFSGADTLLFDAQLFPKETYSYKLYSFGTGKPNLSSEALTITTMDTTSHDFTWQIDTLGDGNGSRLNDVAIINDTLVYAVGEMYLQDSLGNWDSNAYNIAKWNGSHWELKRIPFVGPCSGVDYPPLRAIWAFSDGNILVTNGGSIVRYDGSNAVMDCQMNSLLTGAINKIYAIDLQNIYAVGNNGAIIHYAFGAWNKLESGTSVNINDIFADRLSNNDIQILVAASNRYTFGETKLLQVVSSGAVNSISWSPQQRLQTVWFTSSHAIYVGGGGLFVGEPGRWKQILDVPNYYSTRLRGNGGNDIIVVGAFGLCGHYNGATWRNYSEIQLGDGTYEGLAVSSKLVVSVGQVGTRAVVARGHR